MMLQSLRGLAIFGTVVVALFAAPPESKAIFHWLRNCFRPRVTYQPVAPAPVCDPCAQQAVQYVPQTAYRTQIVNIPVTTMQPVTVVDPCTGCPVTSYRPVTAFRRQVQMVPYTTYRIVCRPVAYARSYVAPPPASCCGPATATYSAPAVMRAQPLGVLSVPSPAPAYSSPGLSPTPAPSLPPSATIPASPESSAARTYQESSAGRIESRSLRPLSQPQQQPAPSAEGNSSDDNGGPQLNAPASGTINRPIPHTWTHHQRTWPYSQVVWPPHPAQQVASRQTSHLEVPQATRQRVIQVDDGGWRASSR